MSEETSSETSVPEPHIHPRRLSPVRRVCGWLLGRGRFAALLAALAVAVILFATVGYRWLEAPAHTPELRLAGHNWSSYDVVPPKDCVEGERCCFDVFRCCLLAEGGKLVWLERYSEGGSSLDEDDLHLFRYRAASEPEGEQCPDRTLLIMMEADYEDLVDRQEMHRKLDKYR